MKTIIMPKGLVEEMWLSGERTMNEQQGMIDTLYAVKMAYRKHVLNDDSIGWEELGDILKEALCNKMGDDGFVIWLDDLTKPTDR